MTKIFRALKLDKTRYIHQNRMENCYSQNSKLRLTTKTNSGGVFHVSCRCTPQWPWFRLLNCVRFPTQRLGRPAHVLLPKNMATAMSETVDEGLLQEAINFALAKTNMTHIELKKE